MRWYAPYGQVQGDDVILRGKHVAIVVNYSTPIRSFMHPASNLCSNGARVLGRYEPLNRHQAVYRPG